MSVETQHDCPDCECYVPEVKPTPQSDWEGWVEEQRELGLSYVDCLFRPLRLRVGLGTMHDIIAATYEPIIKQQLEFDKYFLGNFQ